MTYLDPAGFITRENGCDMRDATAYKFNAVDNYPKRLYNRNLNTKEVMT